MTPEAITLSSINLDADPPVVPTTITITTTTTTVAKPLKPATKVCSICGKSFRTAYKLTEHMRRHLPGASYKCDHYGCPKMFRSKIGLIEHQAKHTGQHKYPCEICGKGFQIKSYLATHMKTHQSADNAFKCTTCGLALKSKDALINHENRHLGLKPFGCTQCDQKFVSDTLRIAHERTHYGGNVERKYPCPICNKLFVRKSYLKTHLTVHTGDKPFVCDVSVCDPQIDISR